MKNLVFGLMAVLLMMACSCSPLRELRKTPGQKVADLIELHPELIKPETVQVRVPFYVPQVVIKKELIPVHDTIYLQREASELDSLLTGLKSSLDSAEHAAAQLKLQQFVLSRPVLHDTLCFDTLGVRGRIWRNDRVYKLEIIRAAITDTTTGAAVVGRLAPCPPLQQLPGLAWYNPAAWALPWYVWLLLGIILGICLLQGAVMLAYRFFNRPL